MVEIHKCHVKYMYATYIVHTNTFIVKTTFLIYTHARIFHTMIISHTECTYILYNNTQAHAGKCAYHLHTKYIILSHANDAAFPFLSRLGNGNNYGDNSTTYGTAHTL